MQIEIDQSGKIEQLDKNTVLALSNKYQYSILLPKAVKREIYSFYRGKIKHLRYRMYVIAIFHCLRNYPNKYEKIIIDYEYIGKENLIKSLLVNCFRIENRRINSHIINFGRVGKKSNAHAVAIDVFRNNRKPNLILSSKNIQSYLE